MNPIKKHFSLFAAILGLLPATSQAAESSPQADQFANKFGLEHVYKGCKDKATALRYFAGACGLALTEIAFMGDDVNDVPAMELCGLPAAPADAHASAKAVALLVTVRKGGRGAVRELVDHLLPSDPC
jgi:YrbI family 3-deoxy-D-manno-octulosonate 8-phosphate phosphatase